MWIATRRSFDKPRIGAPQNSSIDANNRCISIGVSEAHFFSCTDRLSFWSTTDGSGLSSINSSLTAYLNIPLIGVNTDAKDDGFMVAAC